MNELCESKKNFEDTYGVKENGGLGKRKTFFEQHIAGAHPSETSKRKFPSLYAKGRRKKNNAHLFGLFRRERDSWTVSLFSFVFR